MNRPLMTLSLLSVMTLSAYALNAGTDVISVESLVAGGVELPTEISYATSSYTSPTTETPYLISNVSDENGLLYFAMSMGLRNIESCGYLKEIRVNDLSGTFTVYAGNEPITTSPFSQEGVVTLDLDRETGVVAVDAPYRYIGVWTYETTVSDIEIEWSDEAPQVTAAKPFIVLNSLLGCPSGSTVTIDSETPGASIEVVMTRGGETILSEIMSNPCTLTLEGEVGDKITVEARTVAEGYITSDWSKRTYTITIPMLAEPELSLSSYSSVVTLGADVTLTNPNHEGSMMIYSVCGAETVSTADRTVTLTVDGDIDADWSVTAWCTAEGWDNSEPMEWSGTIVTNVCPAPSFAPAPGEYAAGTVIRISATYPASSVTYCVNGGEWETSTSLWDLSVTLTEDMTVEAYSSATAPYVDSEIVTALFTVEQLGDDCDEISRSMFGDVSDTEFGVYTSTFTVNAADYQLTGRGMGEGMFVNGTGSIRTLNSDKTISRLKVDASFGNTLLIYVSSDEIESRDASLTAYIVDQSQFGQWIEIPEELAATHFYLTIEGPDMANCIDRVVVDYGKLTGIKGVRETSGETIWYDITGRRVAEPIKGLYIRVADGKADKILVR